jgi:hypothetical protein
MNPEKNFKVFWHSDRELNCQGYQHLFDCHQLTHQVPKIIFSNFGPVFLYVALLDPLKKESEKIFFSSTGSMFFW